MHRFLLLGCQLLLGYSLLAQTTILGGSLTPASTNVTGIDAATSTLTVGNTASFAAGDEVLLIQTQGASMASGQTNASFGDINSLNGAGAYEFNTICLIDGGSNEVTLGSPIANSFATTGIAAAGIQLIKVNNYVDVEVNTDLSAPAWDGNTGGVLLIAATGTVTLNANLEMNGKGFRGAAAEIMSVADGSPICNTFVPIINTRFDDYAYTQGDLDAGKKGEGIAAYVNNQEYGQGNQVNGGGGGNEHNAGGGGGGNYGMGGIGSQKTNGACNGDFPGEGGTGLGAFYVAGNSLFMGGGGGAGHSNNQTGADPQGQDGGNGGGIIIIRASLLEGNGFGIYANGANVDFGAGPTPVLSDGQGGGGAGGTIVLDIDNLGVSALTLEASGGKGGDTNSTFLSGNQNCEGPGGGGGGGAVLTSLAAWGLTPDVTGGAAGNELGNGGGCSPNGQAGSIGAVLFNYNPIVASGSNSNCGAVLSASLENASAQREDRGVSLRWTVNGAESITHSSVQRLSPSGHWLTLLELPIDDAQTNYHYLDYQSASQAVVYRIGLIAQDGGQIFSPRLWVGPDKHLPLSLQVFPNPASTKADIWIETQLVSEAKCQLKIYDLSGKRVWQKNCAPQRVNAYKLNLESLKPGVYQLVLKQDGQRLTQALHLVD